MNKAELEELRRGIESGGAVLSSPSRDPEHDPIEVHDVIGALVGHYAQALRIMDHRERAQQMKCRKLEKQLAQSDEALRVAKVELALHQARVAEIESSWTPPRPKRVLTGSKGEIRGEISALLRERFPAFVSFEVTIAEAPGHAVVSVVLSDLRTKALIELADYAQFTKAYMGGHSEGPTYEAFKQGMFTVCSTAGSHCRNLGFLPEVSGGA